MSTNKIIHQFALKYFEKFRDNKTKMNEVANILQVEGRSIGLELHNMEYYEDTILNSNVFKNIELLDKVIDSVTDIQLLGSVILKKHSLLDERWILLPKNRPWFIIAFSKLVILTAENGVNPFVLEGVPKKITIISNNINEIDSMNPDDEVEQYLTINEDGQVWFTSYEYGISGYEDGRAQSFTFDRSRIQLFFQHIISNFSAGFESLFEMNTGQWEMSVTNQEGNIFRFKGSFCKEMKELSDALRVLVPVKNLFLFDGNNEPDRIERITVNYQRYENVIVDARFVKSDIPIVDESLVIDRTLYTLEYIKRFGSFNKISNTYELIDEIPRLLDEFNPKSLFKYAVGNPENVVMNPKESLYYEIEIEYKNSLPYYIAGSFDKNGLPEDWDLFVVFIHQYMNFHNFGEIFDAARFEKMFRLSTEYIYCSVKFQKGGRSYYYLTEDDSIEIGDYVYVLATSEESLEVVEIVNIEYFSKEDAPFPLHKMRRIIRKLTDEDWDDYENDSWSDEE